jgi:hypothetical protein
MKRTLRVLPDAEAETHGGELAARTYFTAEK